MDLPATYPTAVTADDASLVAQARAGSERAFEALYRRHVRYVAGVTYRLLGNDAEVDDVLQEAFLDAAGALAGLREPGEFRAWLVQIAIRRVYRRLASKRRWRWLRAEVETVSPACLGPADAAPRARAVRCAVAAARQAARPLDAARDRR